MKTVVVKVLQKHHLNWYLYMITLWVTNLNFLKAIRKPSRVFTGLMEVRPILQHRIKAELRARKSA